MIENILPNECPKCGAVVPPGAPQGLCPRCLLAQVSAPTDGGNPADPKPGTPRLEAVAAAFPHLEILGWIGQGGMGAVFKARQPKLDRCVALKLLPQSLAADPAFAERFTREGRVLARLSHPNIVAVHDFGQAGGFFYLLMEFVDGVNLRQAMRAGRFTPAQALAVVPKICDALQYAHGEGILHRDIKPENILLDGKGRVKIADFGIAKLVQEPLSQAILTSSGASLGTPHYMAPEQVEKPQDVDHRADIFSLGVVFYEMLTGELPLGRFAAPSEKSASDPRLDDVVFRSLAKERENRQQSAAEVKTQIETISTTEGPLKPPASSTPENRTPAKPLPTLLEEDGRIAGIPVVERQGGRTEVFWPGALQALGLIFYWVALGALVLWLASRMRLGLLPVLVFATFAISASFGFYRIVRARKRYGGCMLPEPDSRRPALPGWAGRVSRLILAMATLGVLRTVWTYTTAELGRVALTVPLELLLVPTSVALMTRNPAWRRAATAGGGLLILLLVAGWAATLIAIASGDFISSGVKPGSAIIAMILSLLASAGAPVSLWTLWHRDVRLSFGDAPGAPGNSGESDALTFPRLGLLSRRWIRVGVASVLGALALLLFVSFLRMMQLGAHRPPESTLNEPPSYLNVAPLPEPPPLDSPFVGSEAGNLTSASPGGVTSHPEVSMVETTDQPRYAPSVICFNGAIESGSSCTSRARRDESGRFPGSGQMTCGFPGKVSVIDWKLIGQRRTNDLYEFTRRFPRDDRSPTTTRRVVEYSGDRVIVFEDQDQVIVIGDTNRPAAEIVPADGPNPASAQAQPSAPLVEPPNAVNSARQNNPE